MVRDGLSERFGTRPRPQPSDDTVRERIANLQPSSTPPIPLARRVHAKDGDAVDAVAVRLSCREDPDNPRVADPRFVAIAI